MKKLHLIRFALAFSIGVCVVGYRWHQRSTAKEFRSYVSSDGRFKLAVFKIFPLMSMPGQGSDAPGFVRFYDQSTVENQKFHE